MIFEGRDLGFPATTLPRALQVCEWVEGIRGGGWQVYRGFEVCEAVGY